LVQIAAATLSGNSFRQTVHTHRASVHHAAKLVAALSGVARVTAGLAGSSGSLVRACVPCSWSVEAGGGTRRGETAVGDSARGRTHPATSRPRRLHRQLRGDDQHQFHAEAAAAGGSVTGKVSK